MRAIFTESLVHETLFNTVVYARGGGTHILGRTGYAALMGRFLQEILKHGSHFLPKTSLNMGQLIWLSPKLRDFRGFRMAKTPKIAEFLKNRPIFEMGILFGQNHP